MALEKLKELEDLKARHKKLLQELRDHQISDQTRILEDIASEFDSFLSGEGFETTRHGNILTAKCGETQLTMKMPETNGFVGYANDRAILTIDFSNSRYPREYWKLFLLSGKNSSRLRRNDFSKKDPYQYLRQEIRELEAKLNPYIPVDEYSVKYCQQQEKDRYRHLNTQGPVVSSLSKALTDIKSLSQKQVIMEEQLQEQ